MGQEWYHHNEQEETWNRELRPLCVALPGISLRAWESDGQTYLGRRGLSSRVAGYNGWNATLGTPARILIPCLDATEGSNRFYQTRATEDWDLPRYDSPPGKVRRGGALAVLSPLKDWPLPVPGARIPKSWYAPTRVVTEGPMCALAAATEGYPSCALLGGSPPEAVFHSLWIYLLATAERVLLIPDRDKPHLMLETMVKLVTWALTNRLRLPKLLVQTPREAKDLADLPSEKRSSWLQAAMS